MHSVKATLILSLTTLISLASYIAYNSHQDRFVLLPLQADKSIYVFDPKNNVLNYCTSDNQCKLIKLNLPAERESTSSVLPASLLSILDGKQSKATETNSAKNSAGPKSTVTVSATRVAPLPEATAARAKTPLVAADIHASAAVIPPLPAIPPMPANKPSSLPGTASVAGAAP
ncbi:MAG: hypothetical protein V4544_06710 [Pseudomonadota bacterium]